METMLSLVNFLLSNPISSFVTILVIYILYRNVRYGKQHAQAAFERDFNHILREVEGATLQHGFKIEDYRKPTYKELKKYNEHFDIGIGVNTPGGFIRPNKKIMAMLRLKNEEGEQRECFLIFKRHRITEKVEIRFKPPLDGKKGISKKSRLD